MVTLMSFDERRERKSSLGSGHPMASTHCIFPSWGLLCVEIGLPDFAPFSKVALELPIT